MDYFETFKKIKYNGNSIVDITRRPDIIQTLKKSKTLFNYMYVRENENPQDVAKRVYGDENLYWILLMINDVVDPYIDWVMSDDALTLYCEEKYSDINGIHHYETTSFSPLGEGVWVDQYQSFSIPISNYAYEKTINDNKRKIKVLKSEYLNLVKQDMNRL